LSYMSGSKTQPRSFEKTPAQLTAEGGGWYGARKGGKKRACSGSATSQKAEEKTETPKRWKRAWPTMEQGAKQN
jgi:hypothetical protein